MPFSPARVQMLDRALLVSAGTARCGADAEEEDEDYGGGTWTFSEQDVTSNNAPRANRDVDQSSHTDSRVFLSCLRFLLFQFFSQNPNNPKTSPSRRCVDEPDEPTAQRYKMTPRRTFWLNTAATYGAFLESRGDSRRRRDSREKRSDLGLGELAQHDPALNTARLKTANRVPSGGGQATCLHNVRAEPVRGSKVVGFQFEDSHRHSLAIF